MNAVRTFDLSFDYRTDKPAKTNPDADRDSPRLRLDHELLWSKQLRSGTVFKPVAPRVRRDGYLIWEDDQGSRRWYGSDAITHSYRSWERPPALVAAKAGLSEDQRSAFLTPGYTIGSSSIWPVKSTAPRSINQGRCFGPARRTIADRIDLTLECIRRYYLGVPSDPYLGETIAAYPEFFDLFVDRFEEFVEFFHFQPLVTSDGVRSLLDGELLNNYEFDREATPSSTDEYIAYRVNTLVFVEARSQLMADWVEKHHPDIEVRR